MNDFRELWNQWKSYHQEPEQIKRQKSACEAKMTPLSVDNVHGSGIFQGSKYQYTATLQSCQCVDFCRRKLPCKHMYRLATELELIQPLCNLKSGNAKLLRANEGNEWKETVEKIEKLSDLSQKAFHAAIMSRAKGSQKFENNDLKLRKEYSDELIENKIFIIDREARVNYYGHISDEYLVGRYKAGLYFGRKFYGCFETRVDPNTSKIIEVKKPYPNDDVSRLLVERGFISSDELKNSSDSSLCISLDFSQINSPD